VAVELGVKPARVYALCRGGGLPHSRVGDSILVRFEELKSWRNKHPALH
jgi:excisionase family DNA binding protein